ncbi:MAG: hypothetical protein FWD22_04465, partial [Treponema sp.]|nr:hypothetical protein [Treponema sp.]
MLKRIDAEIAYANAPWVPLQIEAGNLGTTSLMGSQPKTVKKGYSFNLTFQPSKDYPFAGWQAWTIDEGIIATWRSSENQTNTDKVKFVPKNAEGTQVEIFVYVLPSNGAQLFIGPWGATADNLSVLLRIQPAWGTSNPPAGNLTNPVPKPGIPFLINYFPSAEFEFKEWEAEYQDENNIWKITNDDSIVKFEDPGSPITSVIINTTAPVRLRPNVQERPFIESTNIVFGRQEYTDFNVMINFSDRMIKETLNWDTISISINNNVIDKEKARATFRFSSNPEDEFAELSDGDRLLIFRPDGDLVPPNARIEITFKQEKEDGSAGVQSVGGTSLTRDIIIRYNCGPGKSPKKPMFAG